MGEEQSEAEREFIQKTRDALAESNRLNSAAPIAEILSKFGGDVDVFVGSVSLTALCCIFNCSAALRFLFEQGADPKLGSRDGLTPGIHFACAMGTLEHVEMFLKAGADPLFITPDEKQSCLHRVAEHGGNIDIAKLLINLGVPVDHPDYNGFTPLHFACWKDKPHLVELLLDSGADIEWPTKIQSTPLITAVYHRSRRSAMILLSRGADITAKNAEKMSPLDAARIKKDSWMVVELIERGAPKSEIAAPTPQFDMTMARAGIIMTQMYREKPKLPEGTLKLSQRDFTHLAAFNDVNLLIKYQNANPEYKLEEGSKIVNDMIQIAVHSDATAILSYLRNIGISLDGDGDERSPLMNAVQYGHEEVVKFLLRAEVDILMEDYEHCTARSLAIHAVLHEDAEKAERIFQLVRHGL